MERAAASGAPGAKAGAVTVVQRTSSDLRLNPHLHAPPRFHTVKYAGVLAPASTWRSRIAPPAPPAVATEASHDAKPKPTAASHDAKPKPTAASQDAKPKRAGSYRPWAELLKRTFGVDVLQCKKCKGGMKLVAMVTDPKSVARYLAGIGELTDVPGRSPSRGPPYWKGVLLRVKALGDTA